MNAGNQTVRLDLSEPLARTAHDRLVTQLRDLPAKVLPLQAGCVQGGWVDLDSVQLTPIGVESHQLGLKVTMMAYFEEVVGGCNCSEDPVPHPAALRLRLSIAPDGLVTDIEPMPD